MNLIGVFSKTVVRFIVINSNPRLENVLCEKCLSISIHITNFVFSVIYQPLNISYT